MLTSVAVSDSMGFKCHLRTLQRNSNNPSGTKDGQMFTFIHVIQF